MNSRWRQDDRIFPFLQKIGKILLDKSYRLEDNLNMELSPARSRLAELIARHDTNMTELSRDDLGKNPTYIQQYITRRQPRKLDEGARQKLATFFDMPPYVFKGAGAIAEGNRIVARQPLRRRSLRSIGNAPASNLKLIQVIGDSMTPTFKAESLGLGQNTNNTGE